MLACSTEDIEAGTIGEGQYSNHPHVETITLFNLQKDTLLSFDAPNARFVAFAPECADCSNEKGRVFLTSDLKNAATLYNLQGDTLQHFDIPGLEAAGFTPDGQFLYFKTREGKLSVKTREGKNVRTLQIPESLGFAFSPPCTGCPFEKKPAILTGRKDGSVRLTTIEGAVLLSFEVPGLASLAFIPAGPEGKERPFGNGPLILTGSNNGEIRVWDLKGKEISAFPTPSENALADVACSSDEIYVLTLSDTSGPSGGGVARMWNLKGDLLQQTGFQPARGVKAAFTPEGHIVFTTYQDSTPVFWNMDRHYCYHAPPPAAGESFQAFSPDGQYTLSVFKHPDSANEGGSMAILRGRDGNVKQEYRHNHSIDYGDFSADGQHIYTWDRTGHIDLWGLSGQLEWSMLNEGHSGILYTAVSPQGNFAIHCLNEGEGSVARLLGRKEQNLPLVQSFSSNSEHGSHDLHRKHSCATFSHDEQYILEGDRAGVAQLWDLQGNLKHRFKGHTAALVSVALSPACPQDRDCPSGDKHFALTGSEDGTAKLWDSETGEELATIIPAGREDWVCICSNGLFDASPKAMEMIYFSAGQELIELEQLKERYYEPGLMDKLLGISDEPIRSVEGFDTVALYPIVQLELDSQARELQIELTPRNGGIGPASVFINGKEVIPDANPSQGFEKTRSTSILVNLSKFNRYFLQDTLNTISVRACNEAGWLKSPARSVAYRPNFARSKGAPGDTPPSLSFQPLRDPSLYAIIVGTANYAGTKLDLKFPGKDAAAMAQAIQQAGGQLFEDRVHVRLFTTDTAEVSMHPTRSNIKAAFEAFKGQAVAEDILLVYLSGHGITYGDAERAQFYYLTQEIGSIDLSDEGIRKSRTVSSAEFTKWINDIPAQKQVMIIDACNSGKVVEILDGGQKALNSSQIRALDRMKDRTGMYVLAGSAADKVSYEASQYGQGLLTYSLLEGMSGLVKLREGKYVDVVQLFEYTRDKVPEMAESIGGIQSPTMLTPRSGSIDIGIVNEKVNIQLAPRKPVFIRNVFQNEDSFDDELGLGLALADYFRSVTAKGAQAELIYVDVSEYENAYSLKGLYGVAGDAVTVRARLFKGKTVVGEAFTVTGKKEEAPGLVEAIMAQVDGMLK